jgi:hypothetical protein
MNRKDINLIAEAYGALTPSSGRFGGPMPAYDEEVDAEQLQIGIEVEKEHTDDEKLAEKIARDHLAEDPHYYTKLNKAGL